MKPLFVLFQRLASLLGFRRLMGAKYAKRFKGG